MAIVDPQAIPALIGSSAATRALDGDITAASRSDAKVLITGESGVGKDVAARLIHERSPRVRQTLVTINCAGLPDSLLETELFGHVKGSFTDAHRDRPGLLQVGQPRHHLPRRSRRDVAADAGAAAALPRDRRDPAGRRRPAGAPGSTSASSAPRIATCGSGSATGTFREDLFYRLNVVHIHIPPLRERREDVRDLIQHFLAHFAEHHGIAAPTPTPDALALLLGYDWPGNVRELRNVIERVVLRRLGRRSRRRSAARAAAGADADRVTGAGRTDEETRAGLTRRLMGRMLVRGESFWDVVYAPFLAHDLTPPAAA